MKLFFATAAALAFASVAALGSAPSAAADGIGKFSLLKEPKPVPQVEFLDAEERKIGLEAFRGKIVVLNLWATWCAPCREEMPSLDRLQAKLGGPDLEVVALSVDRGGLAKSKAFLDQLGATNLRLYGDPSMKVLRLLGVPGLPVTIVIDREGRELGRLLGTAEWDGPAALGMLRRFMGQGVLPGAKTTGALPPLQPTDRT
jgi:thiol-disulfide isomerase/thioredoxin